jgi:hypothetical protein
MRKLFFLSFLSLLLAAKQNDLHAQSQFDGYWAGTLKTADDDDITVILKISSGVAKEYNYDEDLKRLVPYNADKEATNWQRNNLCFTWLNQGGVWTETQTYMLSYLSGKKLSAIWVRQVNNIKDTKNENEAWSVQATGTLTYYTRSELDALFD